MSNEKPATIIERLGLERAERTDGEILGELRALSPLPDERDAAWDLDETWARAYLLVALADRVAARRLEQGVGPVLDKLCLGDPGEMNRGMRHAFEAAVSPSWSRLAEICVSRCSSSRAGTRYWALDELAVLRDPTTLPTVLSAFDDPDRDVAEIAVRAAVAITHNHPQSRSQVVLAMRDLARRRSALRDEAQDGIAEIQSWAPALGEIDDPESEARLVDAIRAYRAQGTDDGELGHALELLLVRGLEATDEWDPNERAPDGVMPTFVAFTAPDTLELHAQVWALAGPRSSRTDPLHATITVSADGRTIEHARVRYADAAGRSVDAAKVTDWLFELRK